MLTLIWTYYENPGMLQEHCRIWQRYPAEVRESVRVIVVDDGSQKHPALEVEALRSLDVDFRLYRVTKDIPWNWDGARNLGMTVCETEWAWFLDMDRAVLPLHAARAAAYPKKLGRWYRPNQRRVNGDVLNRPHPNCYIVSREDFWKTGGHDEDFQGFYDKDKTFERRLSHVAVPVFVPKIFMLGYRRENVPDCDTRKGRKNSPYHMANAPADLRAKAKGPFYVAENPLRFPWVRQI